MLDLTGHSLRAKSGLSAEMGTKPHHAPIKKLIVAAGGFKLRKRAWSTIQGFESLRMLNKGQFDFWLRNDKRETVVRERSAFINRLFNVEVIFE